MNVHDPAPVSSAHPTRQVFWTDKIFADSRLSITRSPGTKSGSVKGPGLDMIVSKCFLHLFSSSHAFVPLTTYHFARSPAVPIPTCDATSVAIFVGASLVDLGVSDRRQPDVLASNFLSISRRSAQSPKLSLNLALDSSISLNYPTMS